MVAKVGDDPFGIDTAHVRVQDGVSSGVAAILVEPTGQNRVIVVKGANDALVPADVHAGAADLANVDAIILQFEIPLETVYHTVRFARTHSIRCIVNPAPALPANLGDLCGAAQARRGIPVATNPHHGSRDRQHRRLAQVPVAWRYDHERP